MVTVTVRESKCCITAIICTITSPHCKGLFGHWYRDGCTFAIFHQNIVNECKHFHASKLLKTVVQT